MKAFMFSAALILSLSACDHSSSDKTKTHPEVKAQSLAAPAIEKRPVEITMHGDTRIDNYAWLKNLDIMLGKAEPSAELQKVVEEQNAYTQAVFKSSEGLYEAVKNEFKSRRVDRSAETILPYKIGDYEYWKETKPNEIIFRLYRKKIGTSHAELLIDGPALAGKAEYIGLTIGDISPKGTYLPFLVDMDGNLQGDLMVKNMITGETSLVRKDIVKTVYLNLNIAWSADEKYIFYSVPGTLSRDSKVARTNLSIQPFAEEDVYDELDGDFFLKVIGTASKKFILLESSGHSVTVYRAIDATNVNKPMIQFSQKRQGHEYTLDHANNQFIIRSNREKGLFSIWTATAEKAAEENWKLFNVKGQIPTIETFKLIGDHMFISGHDQTEYNAVLVSLKDGSVRKMEKPDFMSVVQESDNFDATSNLLRYIVWSPTREKSVFEMDLKSYQSKKLSELKVNLYNPEDYEVTAVNFPSTDGVQVKGYLLKKKSLKGQKTPVFIDLYGHYDSTEINWWKYSGMWGYDFTSLLSRGVAVLVPFLRGGSDIDLAWKQAGAFKNKIKTLEDSVAVVKGLSDQGLSSPDQIAVRGYSAGGLNAGFIATHAPQAVKAIVARSAFVDLINTMTDVNIPLTTQEFNVWGNPIDSKEDYFRMKSYSPYDNTPDQEYPAIYAHISLHDSQVGYWESLKWIAQLRDHQKGTAPLLIELLIEGNHGGGAGEAEDALNAREQTFILNQLGFTK